jgi:hypothetical protein
MNDLFIVLFFITLFAAICLLVGACSWWMGRSAPVTARARSRTDGGNERA